MKVVFLDHQLISQIRSHLTMRTTQGIQIARTVDDEMYTLSSLPAILNPYLAKTEHIQDGMASYLKEVKVLEKFYKKAHVAHEFLGNSELNLISSLPQTALRRLNYCFPFISYLHQCISQSTDAKNKDAIQDEIFAHAAKFRIEGANPLIILAVAALYGHPLAKSVFAPKTKKKSACGSSFNTQTDFINIFLLPDFVAMYSKQVWHTSVSPIVINYTLLTPNEAYNELIASLEISGQPQQMKNEDHQANCAFDINITVDLFPEIANDTQKMNKLVSSLIAPVLEPGQIDPNSVTSH